MPPTMKLGVVYRQLAPLSPAAYAPFSGTPYPVFRCPAPVPPARRAPFSGVLGCGFHRPGPFSPIACAPFADTRYTAFRRLAPLSPWHVPCFSARQGDVFRRATGRFPVRRIPRPARLTPFCDVSGGVGGRRRRRVDRAGDDQLDPASLHGDAAAYGRRPSLTRLAPPNPVS